jgi:hypothetical protein
MPISTINQNGLNAPLSLTAPNLGTPSALVLTNATGLSRSALPAGSVLQVVNVDYGTETSTTSTSFSDTGLTASITPTSATSKILIIFTQQGCAKYDNAGNAIRLNLLRSSSIILNVNDLGGYTATININNISMSASYLDSPATTSSVTYKTQFASRISGSSSYVQQYGSNANYTRSTMTLMEIAA